MNKGIWIVILIVIALLVAVFFFTDRDEAIDLPPEEDGEEVVDDADGVEQDEEGDVSDVDDGSSPVVVSYTDGGFSPSTVEVAVGESVVFENSSSRQMWVASDPHPTHTDLPAFDSRSGVGAGEVYEFTFQQEGEWGYHDHLTPNHGGTVIVR